MWKIMNMYWLMGNYVNDLSIYGLMNKNAFINYDSDKLSFYKNKIKSKVVFFERLTEDEESKYEACVFSGEGMQDPLK